MAQTRFINHGDPINSHDIGRARLGAVAAGLLTGFDQWFPTGGTGVELRHTSSAGKTTTGNVVAKSGNILHKTGVIIEEDAPIALTVTLNANANPRRDRVIVSHDWTASAGGSPATYSIITGTPAAVPTLPALTDAANQVTIGEIWIPGTGYPGGNTPSVWTWIPHKVTGIGRPANMNDGITATNDGDWIPLDRFLFENGWQNATSDGFAYRVAHDGSVHFRGIVQIDTNDLTFPAANFAMIKWNDHRIYERISDTVGIGVRVFTFNATWEGKGDPDGTVVAETTVDIQMIASGELWMNTQLLSTAALGAYTLDFNNVVIHPNISYI